MLERSQFFFFFNICVCVFSVACAFFQEMQKVEAELASGVKASGKRGGESKEHSVSFFLFN